VPGTVVPSGSLITPSGDQGPTGAQGPTGPAGGTSVSANANNKATLGSDSLVLVQGVASGVAATTHAQTVSGDDPQLTNARTPTAHAATHKSGGSDLIALDTLGATTDITTLNASSSAHGLLPKLSGTATSYLDGTGAYSIPAGPALGFITKTSAYTLTTADSGKFIICSGGSWTLTLPAPVLGLTYDLRNDMGISGTTGTITIQPTGGTIDGAASLALLPQQECKLRCDGTTNWRTFGLRREMVIGTQDITSSTASGTVLLPVGYRYFQLEFAGLQPAATNDQLVGQLSNNGGSSWITTGYYVGTIYNTSATAVAFSDAENAGTFNITGNCLLGQNYGEAILTVYPGLSAAVTPSWRHDSISRNNTSLMIKYNGGGVCISAGPANALKYFMAGSNIVNSFLTVKGVV